VYSSVLHQPPNRGVVTGVVGPTCFRYHQSCCVYLDPRQSRIGCSDSWILAGVWVHRDAIVGGARAFWGHDSSDAPYGRYSNPLTVMAATAFPEVIGRFRSDFCSFLLLLFLCSTLVLLFPFPDPSVFFLPSSFSLLPLPFTSPLPALDPSHPS